MNILLYGYGVEGKSSEKYFKKNFPKDKLQVFDEHIPEYSKVPEWEKFDRIVVSAGICRDKIPAVCHPRCTSNVEIFFSIIPDHLLSRVIGIGGTKGKSTTTKFCHEFLENAGFSPVIGGNFGVPFLDILDDFLQEKYDFLVAELSSFQLEYLQKSPHIAIFLNFFPDHLDRHKTIEAYFLAKQNLWKHQTKDDFLVLPESIGISIAFQNPKSRVILSTKIKPELFPEKSVFRAPHFLENFGVIFRLADILKIKDPEKIFRKTAKDFIGLPHRLEFFSKKNGISFYDDSISTNPGAVLAAINFFQSDLGSIVLGGQNRNQNFSPIVEVLEKQSPHATVIVYRSETSSEILKTFEKTGWKNIFLVEDLIEAAQVALHHTLKGKCSVLSCAAPSWDRFKNYKERGERWKTAVEAGHSCSECGGGKLKLTSKYLQLNPNKICCKGGCCSS